MGLDIFPDVDVVHIGAFTGSASTEEAVWIAPAKCVILGVSLVDKTGVTGHTQNYGTATITNKGTAGSGTTSVAARSTNVATTANITAWKAWPVTLSTTAADLQLAAGDVLTFAWTEAGSGQDLGGAALQIKYALGSGAGN